MDWLSLILIYNSTEHIAVVDTALTPPLVENNMLQTTIVDTVSALTSSNNTVTEELPGMLVIVVASVG